MSKNSEEPKDFRVEATRMIGVYSVAMLGISIPLAAITQSGQIPALVIVGSALSTAAVWAFGGRPSPTVSLALPSNKEQERIHELEERLANLEAMDSYERQVAIERQIGIERESVLKSRSYPIAQ